MLNYTNLLEEEISRIKAKTKRRDRLLDPPLTSPTTRKRSISQPKKRQRPQTLSRTPNQRKLIIAPWSEPLSPQERKKIKTKLTTTSPESPKITRKSLNLPETTKSVTKLAKSRQKRWKILSGCEEEKRKYLRSDRLFHKLVKSKANNYTALIRVDMKRTFPNHKHFRSTKMSQKNQLKVFEVLHAYSYYNPEIGYTQGLNFVVGMLLIHGFSEEEAFWILVAIVKKSLMKYYEPGMTGVYEDTQKLSDRVEKELPELYKHFEKNNVSFLLFTPKWLLTLFSDLENWNSVIAIWELLMLNSEAMREMIVNIGFCILQACQEEILKRKSIIHIVPYLLSPPAATISTERLFPEIM